MNVKRLVMCLVFVLFALEAHAGPSYDAYTEGWGSGWGNWSWNATPQETTARSFKGSKSMKVTYNAAWAGFGLGTPQNFSTVGYRHLYFAMYSELANNNLWVYARRSSDGATQYVQVSHYTETLTIPSGKWIWVRIPISDFGLGGEPTISDFGFQSGNAGSVIYFDEITFGASANFYEGVKAEKGPGVQLYYWSATWTQPYSGEDYWLQVTPTGTWGGIQLQQRSMAGIASSDYGALTVVFKYTGSSQTLYVGLIDGGGQTVGAIVPISDYYIPDTLTMQPNVWYRVSIPLSDFLSVCTTLSGVFFQSSTAQTFYVDDVRLIQKFAWVIPGVDREVTGYYFGEFWDKYCSGSSYRYLHVGNDYTDEASSGRSVYAASRGIVKQVYEQVDPVYGSWGFVVVIQHETSLTTNYNHLNSSNVSVGQEVQRGTLLGTTKYLSEGSHLHFGLRVSNYDTSTSQKGALPEVACDGFPTFPSSFIDSQMMNW